MNFTRATRDFEAFLQNYDTNIMASFHPYFQAAFWEMVKNGGKRFRPNLMFAIVCAKKPKRIKRSFQAALALEVLHTYSLIHDDLPAMDDASMRRGHETLHKRYDETGAILAGDALNSYAFYLLARAKFRKRTRIKLLRSLSFGALKMVLGQACDCYFENTKLSKDDIDFIHINKTAHIIASALEMGAIIAKLPKNERRDMYKFGMLLGLYFQIRDDIIDATQDALNAGKTTHNDANKNSYVNLLGLEGAQNATNELKTIILQKLDLIDEKIARNLRSLLKNYL